MAISLRYLCFLYADLLTTAHKDRLYTTRSGLGLAGFQSFRSDLGGLGKICGVSARQPAVRPFRVGFFQYRPLSALLKCARRLFKERRLGLGKQPMRR
jgi:hypothetical protein